MLGKIVSSTREERHENTREQILKAALALIDRDGIHKFSLRAVARKVKYSPAGLYEYFDSKDDIVATLCQIADNKLAAYLSSVSEDLPYHEYLVQLGLAYIRFAREETTYFRLSFVTQISGRESLDEPVTMGAYLILLHAVQRGIEKELFLTNDQFGTEQIAYSLWSIVHGMAMLQTTNLSAFKADFALVDGEALHRFVSGLTQTA